MFYVHPHLGKIPILANIFQRGWFNHQLDKYSNFIQVDAGNARDISQGNQKKISPKRCSRFQEETKHQFHDSIPPDPGRQAPQDRRAPLKKWSLDVGLGCLFADLKMYSPWRLTKTPKDHWTLQWSWVLKTASFEGSGYLGIIDRYLRYMWFTPQKANMTGWNIPIFNRKYIDSFMVGFSSDRHVWNSGG